jgi:hypothetical protein
MENSIFENMNHKNMTLAFAAIIAVVAVTAVVFAVPQHAVAYGHHNHNSNSIKVDQQINQLNACTNSSFCQNDASNDAQIHR